MESWNWFIGIGLVVSIGLIMIASSTVSTFYLACWLGSQPARD